MASSLDVIGPLTNSVEDAALLVDVMAGKDSLDSTTIDRDTTSYTKNDFNLNGQKIGRIKEYFDDSLDPNIKQLIQTNIDQLAKAGAEIVDISLPSLPLALAVYYIVCPAEVSSNLSRYDGQRFGYSFPGAKSLEDSYLQSRSNGFGKEAKRRIMVGTYVLSSGYYDAYYVKAQTVRTKLINEFNKAFTQVRFLVGPTAPMTAFKIGENVDDPLKMYLTDIMTVGVNLAGLPAISLPCGMVNGLPVGLQLIAPQRADRELFGLAKMAEGLDK
jgi:aspartyl-tRNA(Asn)/glutamyl-tRNA(Gln) amidotransferase subunit A